MFADVQSTIDVDSAVCLRLHIYHLVRMGFGSHPSAGIVRHQNYMSNFRMNATCFAIAIVGFVILLTAQTPGARYAGTFFAAIGTFPTIALSITWNANNVSDSPTKRAVSVALQSSCGSFGGVIGSYAYLPFPGYPASAPDFFLECRGGSAGIP
jgi:hypothetical protein